MLALDHIQKVSKNRGGIKRVDLIFESDISDMPSYTPASEYFIGSLALQPGGVAYAVYLRSSTLDYQENLTPSSQGDLYKLTFSGTIPKSRPLLGHLRRRLKNSRVSLVFEDFNGMWRIYRKMRASTSTTSGQFGGVNGMEITFTGSSSLPAGFWEFSAGVIAVGDRTCPTYTPEQYVIGDPDADQMIGDPGSSTVIGWEL